MSEDRDPNTVREVVAVFGTGDQLEAAVTALEAGGFTREDISVMASRKAVVENLNHRFETITQMEDDPRVPQTAFVAKSDELVGSHGYC